jgi:hypothetical protein
VALQNILPPIVILRIAQGQTRRNRQLLQRYGPALQFWRLKANSRAGVGKPLSQCQRVGLRGRNMFAGHRVATN